jgi:hypothetical protein
MTQKAVHGCRSKVFKDVRGMEHDRKYLYDALAAIRNVYFMLFGDFTLVQHHGLAATHPVL